jgi:maleylpyruvate isomerase
MNGARAARGARDAHGRLLQALDAHGFDDAIARRPSALPGWSVAHVITHLARNADSHARMIEAVMRGEAVVQYAGGNAQRESEIETGSTRDARALLDDLRAADDAMSDAFARVADDVWARDALRWHVQPWPAFDLPFLRWREVALHTTDLALDGVGTEIWHPEYVEVELRRQLAALAVRVPAGTALRIVETDAGQSTFVMRPGDAPPQPVATIGDTAAGLLAWITGRTGASGRPPLAPWRGIP